jgi:eukaryotic sulfide quinone oxidoreductase
MSFYIAGKSFVVRAFVISGSALLASKSTVAQAEEKKDPKIVIIGGGFAGIGVAAMLKQEGMKNITIIEPSDNFYYAPLWTLVGAGMRPIEDSVQPISQNIPSGTTLVKKSASKFEPESNSITLSDGSKITYDYLVVAAGIQIDWEKIPGLTAALDDPKSGVVSIYDSKYAPAAWKAFNSFEKGRILFTMPNTLIKCAGAPQKIMWLIEEVLRDKGLRSNASVEFWVPGGAMFGVPKYSDMLEVIRKERDVVGAFKQELVSVDAAQKTAVFRSMADGSTTTQAYELLHVVPPMSAPDFIKNSPLAAPTGWMDVHKHTLQSTKFTNIFGLGDCTNTPNSKTAAAVTSQAPVLVHNLLTLIKSEAAGKTAAETELKGHYTGYASCPLMVSKNKVILAEFGYDGKIMETFDRETGKFPYNLVGQYGYMQERFFAWLKSTFFRFAHFNLWVKGWWYGTSGCFKPDVERKEAK